MPRLAQMTVREMSQQRDRFQPAPGVQQEELPLLEKQAIIDEMMRGMPIKQIEFHMKRDASGKKIYVVTKGWAQLRAVLDFMDDRFPTWDDEGRRLWEQQKGRQ
jgi:hypothetical protein